MPESELTEVKDALSELKTQIAVLAEAMRSGDRETGAGVKLIAQAIENISTMQAQTQRALEKAVERFDARIEQRRDEADRKASAVRKAMEIELAEHEVAHSPHSMSLGLRVSRLESATNRMIGGLILAGALGASGLVALIRGFTGN